ncbi:uncharacterized protein LOC143846563 [Tasmannia lanceolata]|uniref:uncharacterized protein LOC143846563 n=1 Tax=Tasmannia lanceolata TaxID=3420 RepID=UPI004064A6E0
MEPTPSSILAKRLWNIVRTMFFMLRKGISKRKLMVDLNLMMKRGKIVSKAIGNLMFHHHHTSHRSTAVHVSSSVAPNEYEFSCSNSPAFPFHVNKIIKNHPHFFQNRPHHHYFSCIHAGPTEDDVVVATLQKTLENLNFEMPEVSPLPVFIGRSPVKVRQVRITDSPFPLMNADDDCHVDKEAEEFIKKFYEQLRLQKKKGGQ